MEFSKQFLKQVRGSGFQLVALVCYHQKISRQIQVVWEAGTARQGGAAGLQPGISLTQQLRAAWGATVSWAAVPWGQTPPLRGATEGRGGAPAAALTGACACGHPARPPTPPALSAFFSGCPGAARAAGTGGPSSLRSRWSTGATRPRRSARRVFCGPLPLPLLLPLPLPLPALCPSCLSPASCAQPGLL